MTTAALSVRVTAELKNRMANHSQRNWSAFIREAVEEEVWRLERQAAARAMDALRTMVVPGGADSGEDESQPRDERSESAA